MIYQNSVVTINKGEAKIDTPIILYRGDREVEINFTLKDSPFKYRSDNAINIIEQTNADYAQLIIKVPNDRTPVFSEITETENGNVIFKITAEMIDEIEEVGVYDFQIRLFDSDKTSRATIPPVTGGIEIREPIAIEDEIVNTSNEVNVATVNYAVTTTATPLDVFDEDGNYIETTWTDKMLITDARLNKIEDGITGVNQKVIDGIGSGSGMTTTVKNALLNCFAHVAWIDENGKTYYDTLEGALLENVIHVTGIELNKTAENVYTGYSTTVTATVSPSNATDKTIIWTSSEESVATIYGSGNTITVNCISDGSSVITATTVDGGYIATFTVTVDTAQVTGISVVPSTLQLSAGDTATVTANVTPNEAANKTISWSTSSSSIATVTPSSDTLSATIEAIGSGDATITATTNQNAKTAQVAVSVFDNSVVYLSEAGALVANSAQCNINQTTSNEATGSPAGVTVAAGYSNCKVISVSGVKKGDILVVGAGNGSPDTVYLDLSSGTPESVSNMVVKNVMDNYSWYKFTLTATKDIDLLYISYRESYDDNTHVRATWSKVG